MTLTRLQHADGGWSTTDLGPWKRVDGTPLETRSDGYATALIVLVLEETGARYQSACCARHRLAAGEPEQGDRRLDRLVAEQGPRSQSPMPGHFMSDAATAYAVLALEARK